MPSSKAPGAPLHQRSDLLDTAAIKNVVPLALNSVNVCGKAGIFISKAVAGSAGKAPVWMRPYRAESRPLARPDNSCQRAGRVCLPAEE